MNTHSMDDRSKLSDAILAAVRIRRCSCMSCMANTPANQLKHVCKPSATNRKSTSRPSQAPRIETPAAKRARPMAQGRRWTKEEFLQSKPPTRKSVSKQEFSAWREVVMREVLRGYSQSSAEERIARLLRMTEVVRNNLPWINKTVRPSTPSPQQEIESKAKKVSNFVNIGALRKACRSLVQRGKPLNITDDVISSLQQLHPQEDPVNIPPEWSMTKVTLCPEIVKEVVMRRLAKGAAGGMDGWTRELLVPLVVREESLRELTSMIMDIANADLLPENHDITERLMACPLIALEKDGQTAGVRPIAIESCLVKLASHAALSTISPAVWKDIFPEIQFGAGPLANVETAVLSTRMALSTKIGISVDCRNAFNTLRRETIVNALKNVPGLAPIYKLAAVSLRYSTIAVIHDGQCVASLQSRTGVRQGSVLGPILFCVGLQPSLMRMARTTSSDIFAYMDDITIINESHTECQQTLDGMVKLLHSIGLEVNVEKCFSMFSPTPFSLCGSHLRNENSIAKCLGAAMFQEESVDPRLVKDWVINRMMKSDVFFSELSKCPISVTHALSLLRVCANGKPNFLLRTHAGIYTLEAAQWFDERMAATLQHFIGTDIDETAMAIFRLPCDRGGLGLRSQTELVDVAFNAALKVLTTGQNDYQQHEVCHQLDQVFETQLRSSLCPDQRRHLDCIQGSSVASFPLNISNDVFKYFIRSRGLLSTSPPGTRCKCGHSISTPDHMYRCDAAPRERIARHDVVKKILATTAEKRYTTRIEPITCDDIVRKRPDLIILTPEGEIAVDVAVVFSESTPPQAAANRKRQKYKYITESGGAFVPFIVSHCGAFHDECEDLFRLITPTLEERAELKQSIVTAVLNWNFKISRALCPTQVEVVDDDLDGSQTRYGSEGATQLDSLGLTA